MSRFLTSCGAIKALELRALRILPDTTNRGNYNCFITESKSFFVFRARHEKRLLLSDNSRDGAENRLKDKLLKRREGIFGMAVLLAGLAIIALCLMPILLQDTPPRPLFPTYQQERFFFDLFGLIFACWLLSWVSALNDWSHMARAAQWLGIILLCIDEAIIVVFFFESTASENIPIGTWLAPLMVQTYLIGCFFGFFTLPSLTRDGNKTLTGLSTLLLLLPWLCARDLVVSGAEYLHGIMF